MYLFLETLIAVIYLKSSYQNNQGRIYTSKIFEVMCPYLFKRNALSITKEIYIRHEICTFSYRRCICTSKFKLLCHRLGVRLMVFCCCFCLFNEGIFLVIQSPNFRMFWTFDFCIILCIVFWHFFSFENMVSSKN